MTNHDTLFIGGEWVRPSSAATIEVRNASTGEVPESQDRLRLTRLALLPGDWEGRPPGLAKCLVRLAALGGRPHG